MGYAQDYANATSQILQQRGNAIAQGQLQSGQGWAQALGQIGQNIAALPQQLAQQRAQQQDAQLRGLQIQNASGDLANEQLQRQRTEALNAIIARLPKDQMLAAVKTEAPWAYEALRKQYDDSEAKAAETASHIAAAREATIKANQATAQYVDDHLGIVAAAGYSPAVFSRVLEQVETSPLGEDFKPHIDQIRQQLGAIQDPAQQQAFIKQTVDALMTPDQRKKLADASSAQSGAQVQGQIAAGMQGGLTPDQQGHLAIERGNAAETAAHNRIQEGIERQKLANQQADVTPLTPEGLDAAAMMFAKTGQLPALGMGDKTTRKQIINRSAALMPGLDVAANKADFTANQSSLQNVTRTLDTLIAFENTAGKNLDQFLELAKKIPDTGVPWLNTPVRVLSGAAVGSANQAAFNAARDVALREIARVTNDPKLSGVLSDSARAEVSALSPKNATFAQIKAVAQTLKNDMANVHSSLSEQRDAIQGRIGGRSKDAVPAKVENWVIDPKTGKLVKGGG